MAEYDEAPEARKIADELIPAHHSDLIEAGARIDFVFRDKGAKTCGGPDVEAVAKATQLHMDFDAPKLAAV